MQKNRLLLGPAWAERRRGGRGKKKTRKRGREQFQFHLPTNLSLRAKSDAEMDTTFYQAGGGRNKTLLGRSVHLCWRLSFSPWQQNKHVAIQRRRQAASSSRERERGGKETSLLLRPRLSRADQLHSVFTSSRLQMN